MVDRSGTLSNGYDRSNKQKKIFKVMNQVLRTILGQKPEKIIEEEGSWHKNL